MKSLDELFDSEAKFLMSDNERDFDDEQQDYEFVASIDIFSAPFKNLSKILEKCKSIERYLDLMPYVSKHSNVVNYYPEKPDKKPGWMNEHIHSMIRTYILPSGLYVRFVFGFSGSFKTANERKHLLWWMRKYCCDNSLNNIDLIRTSDFDKLSVSYNDCGDIALAMKYPGADEVRKHITPTNFERVYQRLQTLEKSIDDFFDNKKKLSYDFLKYGGLYLSTDAVCVLNPEKTFLLTPVV